MRTERVLWWFAIACGILLVVFTLFGSRTTWTHRGGTLVTDSAGWDWVARYAGIAAIGTLIVARWARPRVIVAVLGAAAAAVVFGWAAVVSGQYWLDLERGVVAREEYTMNPADGVQQAAVLATVGAGFALVLAVSWLRPAIEKW